MGSAMTILQQSLLGAFWPHLSRVQLKHGLVSKAYTNSACYGRDIVGEYEAIEKCRKIQNSGHVADRCSITTVIFEETPGP